VLVVLRDPLLQESAARDGDRHADGASSHGSVTATPMPGDMSGADISVAANAGFVPLSVIWLAESNLGRDASIAT